MRQIFALWLFLCSFLAHAGTEMVQLTTLNCYWFLGDENSSNADKPTSNAEYSAKAGHLIGLLPKEAPLLVALQEIGNGADVEALAYAAQARYKHSYQHLFAQGKDTATKQARS